MNPDDVAGAAGIRRLREWTREKGQPPLQTTNSLGVDAVVADPALLTLCTENIELDRRIAETKANAMKLIAELHETQPPERPPYHYPTYLGIGLTPDRASEGQVRAGARLGAAEPSDLSVHTYESLSRAPGE